MKKKIRKDNTTEITLTSTQITRKSACVLYLNARSVFPKRSELTHICQQTQTLILAVSETWLDSNISDGSFLPAGYITCCRTDRVGRSRRGLRVLIACQDRLSFKERRDLFQWQKSSWIEVQLLSSRPLLLWCYYWSPTGTTEAMNRFHFFPRYNIRRNQPQID